MNTLNNGMQAVYYRDELGKQPVAEFIEKLPIRSQAQLELQINRLNMLSQKDPPLPFPHSSQLEGEYRELRCHSGRTLYRIIYRRSRSLFILLHIFYKTSAKVPKEEIDIAMRRWNDFKDRIGRTPRAHPRPIGKDAPKTLKL